MARYWINNTGNWNDTSHWSDTSGGVSGATVPTSGDTVYFDLNSFTIGSTITINAESNCNDFIWTGITQNVTLTNSAYNLNVYGDLVLDAKLNTSFTSTGYLYLKATDTGHTIDGNGHAAAYSQNFNRIIFDGIGGVWTLVNDFDEYCWHCFTNGTLNVNGYYIMASLWHLGLTTGNFTLNLSSSYCQVGSIQGVATTLTLNAGTSTVLIERTGYFGRNFTFYNVIFSDLVYGGYISPFTCENLTITKNSVSNTYLGLALQGNITINNTLTITGFNATDGRLIIGSGTIGTQRTMTCNGTLTASNVDFRDIKGAGSASWDLSAITGGSGDCGGNSGITFTPAQKQYFKHTSGVVNWSDASKWFSDITPRTTAGRVPLPQDDVIFDASSFTGTSTLTIDCPRIGRSLDMSGVDKNVTTQFTSTSIECYGSYILGNNITSPPYYSVYFMGRNNNYYLNTFNKTTNSFLINCVNGFYTFLSNYNTGIGQYFRILSGSIDFNDYNLTTAGFYIDANATAYFGNGILTAISISKTSVASYLLSSNNIYTENAILKIEPGSGDLEVNVSLGSNRYINKLWFSGNHTGFMNVTGSNTIKELIIDPGRKVRFTAGTTQTISKLTAIGTAANPITIGSITSAQHALEWAVNGGYVQCDYLNLSYSAATPANTWYAGKNSTNSGNNTGWIFGNYAKTPQIMLMKC